MYVTWCLVSQELLVSLHIHICTCSPDNKCWGNTSSAKTAFTQSNSMFPQITWNLCKNFILIIFCNFNEVLSAVILTDSLFFMRFFTFQVPTFKTWQYSGICHSSEEQKVKHFKVFLNLAIVLAKASLFDSHRICIVQKSTLLNTLSSVECLQDL